MLIARTRRFAALLAAAVAPGLFAHHSAAPHFDLEKTITLEATITQFQFVNPHAYVFFTAPGAGGKPTAWRCELAARTALSRLGWTDALFPAGRKITIKGSPARREDNVCMLSSFITENGREISRNENLTNANPLAKLAVSPATRPARIASGQPNLEGFWLGLGGPGGGPGPGPGQEKGGGKKGPKKGEGKGPGGPINMDMTPEGQAASNAYDSRFDDPAIQCNPANILFGWTHDRHVNAITQSKDQLTLKYGYMDFVRTIHLNTAAHPAMITRSTAGHSIGHWEGDTLIVDTIGFQPGVLIPINGTLHSDQLHVIERFSVDNSTGTLTREYRAEDPLFFKSAYLGRDQMKLSDEPYTAYKCVELSGKNNIRPK
jgi:hypothetical protein